MKEEYMLLWSYIQIEQGVPCLNIVTNLYFLIPKLGLELSYVCADMDFFNHKK